MAKMDERAKAELYKINQEKFFISVIVIAFFLILKINMQVNVLGMLGEITAAGVVLLYLIPYFIVRYKYKVVDEMVKKKLYRLSTAFLLLEMFCLLPIIIIDTIMISSKIGVSQIRIIDTSFLFLIVLTVIINFYGLVRTHNEKFVTKKAAEMPLKAYKKKLLIKTIIANILMLAVIITLILINEYLSAKAEYPDSKVLSNLVSFFTTGILWCILGIPTAWFLHFYYISVREKLEDKLEKEKINDVFK